MHACTCLVGTWEIFILSQLLFVGAATRKEKTKVNDERNKEVGWKNITYEGSEQKGEIPSGVTGGKASN